MASGPRGPHIALDDGDLRSHILALPTWADLEGFMARMEKAFRKDIEDLQADTAHIGGRVEALEATVEDINPSLQALQAHSKMQDQRIDSLLDQLDDVENRSRRVNIRIRGLPEATGPRDIIPSLQGLFTQILGREAPDHIEIDRAHRALRPPSEDPDKPRDIICKLHKYTVKERIMFHVRGMRHVDFDGAQVSLFPDLSRRTLMQRRALKPLLAVLQEAHLVYRWGFPFSLSVTKDGQQITLRNKSDLPHFLSRLGLPPVDIPDWRISSEVPLPARQEPWQQARRRRRNKPRNRQADATEQGPPSSPTIR